MGNYISAGKPPGLIENPDENTKKVFADWNKSALEQLMKLDKNSPNALETWSTSVNDQLKKALEANSAKANSVYAEHLKKKTTSD
jgi:hypothetical protein